MHGILRTGSLCTALLAAAVPVAASAQGFPSKPIRLVASPPGGGNDLAARLLAQGLTERLGQQVVIDGRASGVLPGQIVARATPDGHTLLFFGTIVWLLPLMISNSPYDPLKDFSWVTLAITSPNVLVVHPTLPVKSVKELIAMAKARAGELNYSSASTGASNHLAAELFKSMAGVNIVRVPYKGSAPALNALLAAEVQLMFPTAGAAMPLEKSGRLRVLAVTSAQPSALTPGLPTLASAGLPGYQSEALVGVFAPAGTPAPIVRKLNQEMVAVLKQPDARDKLLSTGVEVIASTPEQFESAMKSEMTRLGKLIRETGIRAE